MATPIYNSEYVDAIDALIPKARRIADGDSHKFKIKHNKINRGSNGHPYEIRYGTDGRPYKHCFWTEFYHTAMKKLAIGAGLRTC